MFYYIDPALITIGPVSIRYYGLVYALAFLAFYVFLLKRRFDLGLSDEECSEFLLVSGISMMVFGRFFHFLFDNPALLFENPLEFFAIWQGGIAFFGSFIGLIIGSAAYLKFRKKTISTFFKIADIAAVVGSAALIFGRIANFINQELVGTATDVSWCFNFLVGFNSMNNPVFDPICRHPYPLYAAISHVILFIIVLLVFKSQMKLKEPKRKTGFTFITFGLIYGITRFIVDFWREDTRLLFGLTSWQFVAIGLTIISAAALYLYTKRENDTKKDSSRKKH